MKVMDISANRQGVCLDELFGIEIEVEQVLIPNIDNTIWSVIDDGSLRNSGFEFVSRPCTYGEAKEGITKFYEWYREHNYQTSVRTSTHVHYNVLDYNLEELAAALTVYSIVEPLLFRVCGEEREENIYCVPWYRATNETMIARCLVSGRSSMLELACKYSALYLEPVTRFGTVEFRHAPVFNDVESLMFWIDLVRAIMVRGRELETGRAVLHLLCEKGIDAFVESVFGEELSKWLLNICGRPFEEIIDDCDSISVADMCVPSSYTYKVTDAWEVIASPEGAQELGYHRTRQASVPMYEPEEAYPDDYGEDEEYNEEEW